MRVNGVDRPWWWSRSPWLSVGFPTLLLITNIIDWYRERSTLTLVTTITFLLMTVAGFASLLATRRRLEWERREF